MAPILSALLIGAGSIPVFWISRRSLLHPSSYGFYRFFAVEAVLGLLVLNAPEWSARPLGPRQLFSWLLLAVSVATVVSGSLALRRLGRPRDDSRQSPGSSATLLVTSGPYRCIRHPLYASLLFLAWGVFLKAVSPVTIALVLVATAALIATARAEEIANLRQFGQAYQDYMRRTRLFIPFVF